MSLTVLSSPIPAGLSGLMTADAAADISSEGQGFSALLASQLNALPGLELALDDVAKARQALKGELAGGPDRPVRSGISLQEMLAAARATRPLQKPSEGLEEETRTTGSSGLTPWLSQASTELPTSAPVLADVDGEDERRTLPEPEQDTSALAMMLANPQAPVETRPLRVELRSSANNHSTSNLPAPLTSGDTNSPPPKLITEVIDSQAGGSSGENPANVAAASGFTETLADKTAQLAPLQSNSTTQPLS